jgi:exonuclease V
MTASRRKDKTSSTSSLTKEQEVVQTKHHAGNVETALTSSASHADDGLLGTEVTNPNLSVLRQPENDTRSPLERFRSPPKKTLSVTDLVSPAWCELQYWYSLTKFGRVRQTPIMKQGTRIHKEKELEVHTEVQVEPVSAEDRFGIKLWNMIAGLRILRMTGLTRELGVIGLIDGEVINGVIDELSYTCPDEEEEAAMYRAAEASSHNAIPPSKKRKGKKSNSGEEVSSQRTLTEYLVNSATTNNIEEESQSGFGTSADDRRSIYLVDIKTRKAKGLPSATQMRPTRMQLMLYHRLLSGMARGDVEADRVFQRYRLDKDLVFSDTFIASMSNVDAGSSYGQSSEDDDGSPDDPMTELLVHNTLSKLWTLTITEFSRTFTASPLSPLLTAEYRASANGDVIGKRSFALEVVELSSYVASEMQWWRGERPARGVEIEEASKCGICDFVESCSWRKAKVEQAAASAKSKKAATLAKSRKATRAETGPVV